MTLGESGDSVIAERVLIAVGRAPVSGGLGFENVRNYDGSWTEWGNSVRVPIER